MLRIVFTSLLLTICSSNISAQQYDRFWLTSYSTTAKPPFLANILDFRTSPPTVSDDTLAVETFRTAATMCDAAGNLLFYTNGGQVRGADHHLLENGDSLNVNIEYTNTQRAFPLTGSLILLPGTQNKNLYHIIHQKVDYCGPALPGLCRRPLLHTLVDISANNGKGKVVFKNKPLVEAWALYTPTACRHANGRDWWIVVPDVLTASYHTLLFNDTGIVDSFTQKVGYKPNPNIKRDAGGAKIFSPDGSKYVDYDPRNGHRIFDFDRCTGVLSNFKWIELWQQIPFGGIAISPNSRFMYITASTTVVQYDLYAEMMEKTIEETADTVAVWDGFSSPVPPSYTTFGECQLAMDDKIYIAPNNGVKHLHYIARPDLKGDSCQVVQHGLELPNWYTLATPFTPNYRLYDLQGSPCDTLGINGYVSATKPEPLLPPGDDGIHLAPNPASDFLSIESAYAAAQPLRLRIYDAQGRLAHEQAHPRGVRSYTMDVSGLGAGCYFVEVEMADGGRVVKKVVIIR